MRTYDEIWASGRDERPFANGTEGFSWMENWCWRPCHTPAEKAWQDYEAGKRKHPLKEFPGGCPLIQVAMMGRIPTEWLEQDRLRLGDQFHCVEFKGPDDGGGGEPQPKPEPPDMEGLFPRPERRVRMLTQAEPVREAVLV